MTDTERALLAAITGADLTDPDALRARWADDTPRLAYADFLEETAGDTCDECHGSCLVDERGKRGWKTGGTVTCPTCSGSGRVSDGRRERAEFIRVQCELARIHLEADPKRGVYFIDGQGHYKQTPETKRWEDLNRRVRELLDGGWMNWRLIPAGYGEGWRIIDTTVEVSDGAGNTAFSWTYFRGFVSHVTCSWSDWRTHAAAIVAAQPVERIRLTDRPSDNEICDALSNKGMRPVMGTAEGFLGMIWPGREFELPGEEPHHERSDHGFLAAHPRAIREYGTLLRGGT